MLGVQNVRTGSLRLLLAIGVALSCHAQKSFADSPDPSGVLEMRGPEASQNLDAYSPSDWSWLPAYKRDSLSPEPYTLTNRVWETLSDEAAPLASVFLVHYLSKHAGLLHQALTGADGQQAADCARRLGEAVGDLAISQTPGQWLWRLFISNSDLLQGHSTTRIPPTLFWLFRRTLAYAPLLSQTLPDILRQHVLGAIGTAGIVFEPAELNDYFMLTFVSASASHDPGAPGSAFLDLDFLNTPRPLERPGEGRFEKALMALDALSRKEAITRVRLYPRVEPQENGDSRLVLFVRAWLAGRPGQLVRVPGDFGSARERMWWTDAVDQGRFQGVYNNDHYRVVQWTNSLLGYRKAQVTPLSDQIMEQLTSVLKPVIAQDKAAVAGEQTALSGYDEPFERQMDNASRAARDLPAVDQPDNRGLAGLPLQSMHHSVLAMGQETGLLFVDDWLSQRAELPLFTLKSRARYSAIAPDAVLDLENYLPPPPARGSKQLAVALARGQAYSWLVSRLIQTRAEELRSHREALQKYHPLLANDRAALEELASREAQLTQGRSLQELLDEQSRKVTEEHSGDLEGYREQQATVDTVKAETVRLSTRLEALDKGIVTADATKARMEQAYDQACESLRVEDKQQLEATRAELMSMDAPLPEKRRLFQRKTADYKDTAREGANSLWRLYEAQSELSKLQETLAATNEKMTDNQRALAERRAALHKTVRSNPELARLVQLQQVRTLSPLTESEGAQLSPADVQESLDTLRETAGGRFPGVAAVGHVTGSVGDFATTAWHALSATGGQIGSGVRAVIPARALSLFSPATATAAAGDAVNVVEDAATEGAMEAGAAPAAAAFPSVPEREDRRAGVPSVTGRQDAGGSLETSEGAGEGAGASAAPPVPEAGKRLKDPAVPRSSGSRSPDDGPGASSRRSPAMTGGGQKSPEVQHQGSPEVKHQGSSEMKHQGSSEMKHQGSSEMKHQGAPEVKHQGAPEVKHQGAPEVRRQETNIRVRATVRFETDEPPSTPSRQERPLAGSGRADATTMTTGSERSIDKPAVSSPAAGPDVTLPAGDAPLSLPVRPPLGVPAREPVPGSSHPSVLVETAPDDSGSGSDSAEST